jgi:Leucine-rich repeat (LRR) protein
MLKTLNLQNTGTKEFSPQQLFQFPQLEIFILAKNNLRDWLAADSDALLFRGGKKIKTLDLSHCQLVDIPYLEFSFLVSLQYLNLSDNNIVTADWLLENITQLVVLNLSNNAIEILSTDFVTTQLNNYRGLGTKLLDVDLSKNPLSCLCNATSFINWIQTQTNIDFTNLVTYQCLYPDGTWPNLLSVNTTALISECAAVLQELNNNSPCPCSSQTKDDLYKMRYALAEYYCEASDGTLFR